MQSTKAKRKVNNLQHKPSDISGGFLHVLKIGVFFIKMGVFFIKKAFILTTTEK